MSRTPGLMGRLPVRAVALGDLTHYLTEPLPDPPATVAAPELAYPMALNDTYGDCTIAGVLHTDQASAAQTSEPWSYPGDQAVEQTYFGLTGGQDTGLVETRVLQVWQQQGLFGRRLAAFAPLAVRHTQAIRQAVALCGAVYTGCLVVRAMQEQFAAGQPWDLTDDSNVLGGHCVPYVGYNATGPLLVTWGRLQQATWRWHQAMCEECYAVITGEVKDRGSLRGVNFEALDHDLAALQAA